MVWDPARRASSTCNEAMARMLGVPAGADHRRPVRPVSMLLAPGGGSMPPEQLPAARVERTKGRVDQEYGIALRRRRRALGLGPLRADRGRPIASVFTPITEAEAKARSAARITTLVDDSPDLVWMFDAHGLIEYASPSVADALGLRQDEVLGRLWRALTHPRDVPVLRAALADAGPDEPRTKMLELRLRTREDAVWVQGQATLRFRNGRAIAVEITGRDVTRMRAAEDRGAGSPRSSKRSWRALPTGSSWPTQTGRIASSTSRPAR